MASALALTAVLAAPAPAAAQTALPPLPPSATALRVAAEALRDEAYPGVIQLEVDARDTARRILQVAQQMPVTAGPLKLYFPRFIPGTHSATGAIHRLAGLTITPGDSAAGAAAAPLPWRRDPDDVYAFWLEVPAGVRSLQLRYQYLAAAGEESEFSTDMAQLSWWNTVLYPAGWRASQISVKPSLLLPAGWEQASALDLLQRNGQRLDFKPVSLETLIDSPAFAGRHLRSWELDAPGSPRPVRLHAFAATPKELEATDAQIAAHRKLVEQADRLFGSRHFRRYEFLVMLADSVGWSGLEHHESSQNATGPGYFEPWGAHPGSRELLAHEYVHSWNGKFRRPAALWAPHLNHSSRNDLLWVYEGLTQYWGTVLAARSGLLTAEQSAQELADSAAQALSRPGRQWRSLGDTTQSPHLPDGSDWRSWSRGYDYYAEGALVWLEADAWIRAQSGGTKSLDDFARGFFGVEDGRVGPLTYEFDDVVAALNAVWPNDWAAFLRRRIDGTGNDAMDQGLRLAGWRIHYADTPNAQQQATEAATAQRWGDSFGHSLGLALKGDRIQSVVWDSPAFTAGLRPSMKLVAVNGEAYSAKRLREAIGANAAAERDRLAHRVAAPKQAGRAPIQLLVRDGDRFQTVTIDWQGGPRWPQLQRIDGVADTLLAGILAPR